MQWRRVLRYWPYLLALVALIVVPWYQRHHRPPTHYDASPAQLQLASFWWYSEPDFHTTLREAPAVQAWLEDPAPTRHQTLVIDWRRLALELAFLAFGGYLIARVLR